MKAAGGSIQREHPHKSSNDSNLASVYYNLWLIRSVGSYSLYFWFRLEIIYLGF